jgi:hypothetical protein
MGCILMIFGMESPALQIMKMGIEALLTSADYIAHLPYAVWYHGYITPSALLIYTVGFMILAIFKSQLRLCGVVPILVSCVMILKTPKPDAIISQSAIAINDNGILRMNSNTREFVQKCWTGWFGQEKIELYYDKLYETTLQGKKLFFMYEHEERPPQNAKYDMIINMHKSHNPYAHINICEHDPAYLLFLR